VIAAGLRVFRAAAEIPRATVRGGHGIWVAVQQAHRPPARVTIASRNLLSRRRAPRARRDHPAKRRRWPRSPRKNRHEHQNGQSRPRERVVGRCAQNHVGQPAPRPPSCWSAPSHSCCSSPAPNVANLLSPARACDKKKISRSGPPLSASAGRSCESAHRERVALDARRRARARVREAGIRLLVRDLAPAGASRWI